MAIWPFRRKGKRSRSRAGDHSTGATVDAVPQPEISSSQGPHPGPPAETSHSEHDDSPGKSQRKIVKRRKHDPDPLHPPHPHPHPHPRSFSRQSQNNNHNPNPNTATTNNNKQPTPPPRAQTSPPPPSSNPIQIPSSRRGQTANDPFASNHNDPDTFVPYHFQNHTSYSSLGHENFSSSHRPPTLHTKPSVAESGILRRKSSKRKADEYAREQEIKAMTRLQKRPATFTQGQQQRWEAAGGPSALSKHPTDRVQSEVSLPNHDSLESSMSDASDSYAFKVSAFDALTPRPVIRYAESPRYMLSRSLDPSRTSNRKDKRLTIPEEDSRRRMDELADDLDAGALRELMERDQRRREQKKLADQEKLQRRLQRRADRQREEERRRARKAEQGEPEPRQEQAKPVQQTEQVQADVEAAGVAVAGPSGPRDGSSSFLPDASKENLANDDDRYSTGDTPPKARDAALAQDVQNQRHSIAVSQGVPKFPAGGSQVSVMDYRAGSTSTPQLQPPRGSATDVSRSLEPEKPAENAVKPMSSWTSFFRRGGSSLRKSSVDRSRKGPPSEFSNASRESFSKSQPSSVPPPPIPERSFLRSRSNVNRTQSKFTEHLHDFPMSPPDSRLHSPEVPDSKSAGSVTRMDSDSESKQNVATGTSTTAPVPVPRRHEDRNRPSGANTPETGPGSVFLSQSLASVDSEGSWLSGKPLRRTSRPLNQPVRSSAPSSTDRLDEYSEEKEPKETAGDDYYSKMTPDPEGEGSTHNRKTSSGQETTDSDRESDILPMHMPQEEEHRTFHQTVAAKSPVLVRPGWSRPKSKEGLLNDFQPNTAEIAEPESRESPVEGEAEPQVHRATSVDLGKRHVRHISAGSAKLLDIPRRDSVDSKGQSAAPASVDTNVDDIQE